MANFRKMFGSTKGTTMGERLQAFQAQRRAAPVGPNAGVTPMPGQPAPVNQSIAPSGPRGNMPPMPGKPSSLTPGGQVVPGSRAVEFEPFAGLGPKGPVTQSQLSGMTQSQMSGMTPATTLQESADRMRLAMPQGMVGLGSQSAPPPGLASAARAFAKAPGFKKGGEVKAKAAPKKAKSGGMMCSPRKKMAMGGMVKGCKRSGVK